MAAGLPVARAPVRTHCNLAEALWKMIWLIQIKQNRDISIRQKIIDQYRCAGARTSWSKVGRRRGRSPRGVSGLEFERPDQNAVPSTDSQIGATAINFGREREAQLISSVLASAQSCFEAGVSARGRSA